MYTKVGLELDPNQVSLSWENSNWLVEIVTMSASEYHTVVWAKLDSGSGKKDDLESEEVFDGSLGACLIKFRDWVRAYRANAETWEDWNELGLGGAVVVCKPIERFPHFKVEPGVTGTIVAQGPDFIGIKLDTVVPGCEAWGNIVQVAPGDVDSITSPAGWRIHGKAS